MKSLFYGDGFVSDYWNAVIRRIEMGPELPPGSTEGGSKFETLLHGELALASVEGMVSAADLLQRTLERAEQDGVVIDEASAVLLMQHTVGSPEDVLFRIEDMPKKEFDATYPGTAGELVRWYVDPLLG